jgi:hypothetical protein
MVDLTSGRSAAKPQTGRRSAYRIQRGFVCCNGVLGGTAPLQTTARAGTDPTLVLPEHLPPVSAVGLSGCREWIRNTSRQVPGTVAIRHSPVIPTPATTWARGSARGAAQASAAGLATVMGMRHTPTTVYLRQERTRSRPISRRSRPTSPPPNYRFACRGTALATLKSVGATI